MTPQNEKALVVGYFLSKFDMEAYEALGFHSRTEAHQILAEQIGTKPATLKNMRDQFDPLHGHRDGWHQRELSPTRKVIVDNYSKYTFSELLSEVSALLREGREVMRNAFKAVCDFCRDYPTDIRGGLPTHDQRVADVKTHLALKKRVGPRI